MNSFAEAAIKRGTELLASDPHNATFQIYTGHLLVAKDAQKETDTELYHLHLSKMAATLLNGYDAYGVDIHLEKQNDCLVFAAASGNVELAKKLAEIEVDPKNSHKFDRALGGLLRAAILGWPNIEHGYNATKTEAHLFHDLRTIGSSSFQTTGIDVYWKATRNRRYANTLHQNHNLFAEAANQVQQNRD